MNEKELEPSLSIAVIGMSGRIPGAQSLDEFWQNLVSGKESITFFTEEELLESEVDRKLINNSSYVRAKGIIENPEYFDPTFFNYSPREAELFDPQHRIFLECAWHAMEDAGYDPFRVSDKIGIFGGTGVPDYHLAISKNPHLNTSSMGMSIIIGNEKDYLTTRIAYKLNLTGTSITIQCACSTSLSAIVLGMQSLLTYQNDMVLAGGVSVSYPQKQGYLYEKGSLDSPDGHCRTFDANAMGTVFSSGAGIVVLKRLSDAVKDGDHIYCVLKGGSTNNDGGIKSSYTAPGVEGQVDVEVSALEMSGVSPETVSYVEAHGTATQIGDPIEVRALTKAFRQYTAKKGFCAIGSVKTNIGHTDVASGVISLIKVALSLQHQMLPPTLHFEQPNPEIDFENSPFYVNKELSEWRSSKTPRRAMVNSFGVGGANACVVVEESPPSISTDSKKSSFLLVLSGKTSKGLEKISSQILQYVRNHSNLNLADFTYTLQTGRALLDHRKFISFSNKEELISSLTNENNPFTFSILSSDKEQEAIFMFPGQGNQYFGMGKDLYQKELVFKQQVDKCCKILDFLNYEYDIKGELFFSNTGNESIHQTIIAQPALFIIEYSLAQFMTFLGIHPKALIGHSIGELVAACISGVISLQDGLKVVIERARITQRLEKGAMLAVFSDHITVSEWVDYPNEISVMNSPNLTVVSGPINTILNLQEQLIERKVSCKQLNTSHAFHSSMMNPSIEPLKNLISKVKLSSPKIPIMSTVTGSWMSSKEAQDPDYWAQHARKPVNFSQAAQKLLAEESGCFIEVGPGHSLESSIKNCAKPHEVKTVLLLGGASSPIPGDKFFHIALGKLWAYGRNITFENLCINEKRKKLPVPGYPFDRKKYVLDFKTSQPQLLKEGSREKKEIDDWFYFPSWKKSIALTKKIDPQLKANNDIWIIFSNNDKMGFSLIKDLKDREQRVVAVLEGGSFTETSPSEYTINPGTIDDYFKLFETVSLGSHGSLRILHLWNFKNTNRQFPSIKEIDQLEVASFYSLLYLAQTLISLNLVDNLHISFIANNVYKIGDESINIFNSLIIGPCRVFKNEYPQIQSRLIDGSYPKKDREFSCLAKTFILENLHTSNEIVVAYRNSSRWIPIYELENLPSIARPDLRSFRNEGVYLITGGTGSIGLCLAKLISQSVKANILLVQRSSFPDRSEWNSWLETHPESDQLSKKIRGIQEIEATGGKVTLLQANVASKSEMGRAIKFALSLYPEIHGVFHCSGSPGGGVISLKSTEKAAKILQSKVRGTLILHDLLKDQNLDFFISSSSVTGILGEKGQVDYCSANAFLDAFANQLERLHPGVYLSINWGAWDNVGMAAEGGFVKEPVYDIDKYRKDFSNRLTELFSKGRGQTYRVSIDPENDWFIDNHRLKGIPTLVGTAFLEFLSEYATKKSAKAIPVLSNIQFISPLMFFSESGPDLRLKISEGSSGIDFKFASIRNLTSDKESEQEHASGTISFQKNLVPEKFDINRLMQKLEEDRNIKKLHEDDPGSILWRGARWKSAKRVFVGNREWLGHLIIPTIHKEEIDLFAFHPALVDFATSFSASYIVDSLYLPLLYEKVEMFSPIEREVFSYVRQNQSEKGSISLDINLLNNKGVTLLKIQGYTLKEATTFSESRNQRESTLAQSDGILPNEGVKAFQRIFSQWATPQVIISSTDFSALLEENTPALEEKEQLAKEISSKHPRPQLFNPYVAPSNEIELAVASIWEEVLGISGLGIDDNFIELGGNSLTGIQVIAQITELFKLNFNPNSLLANPTIRMLSDLVLNNLVESLDEEQANAFIFSIEG